MAATDNILGIFRQAHGLVEKFDREKEDPGMCFRKRLLYALEDPYGKFINEDEMYDAICEMITEEAEIWLAFPDFSITELLLQ